ncbi:hypothetical protein L1049_000435 [Liquidambar formosana]|uniref:SCP domain-containing protein n=1 Tax=Liquidambar formosana TaxID=63359 RepID=A0AAP0NAF8_LIQFO
MAYTKLFSFLLLSTLFLFSSLLPVESTVHRRFMRTKTTAAVAQFLGAHNSIRARHNLPLLQWSTKLANFAKWYANKRRGDCALIHSVSNYGENIFWGMRSRWKPSDAVAAWAAQEAYYDYKDNTCMPNKECLHYTQLVWRSTVKGWLCAN